MTLKKKKTSPESRYRKNIPQNNEDIDDKLTANITLNSEKLKAFLQDQEQGNGAYTYHYYST